MEKLRKGRDEEMKNKGKRIIGGKMSERKI